MELPECPVCLQSYEGEYTIPRVLSCGHTACESCLVNLPQKYPHTVRCPACTQLVKYPPKGPSALPKNIDLLRLICPPQNPDPQNSQKPHKQSTNDCQVDFLPSWSDEFYTAWKEWVLPLDAVLVEPKSEEERTEEAEGGLCSMLEGRIGSVSASSLWFQGCFRENQRVSLFRVVSLLSGNDSVFQFSYVARIMNCLSGMKEEERDELGLILRVSMKQSRICRVLGLWGNLEDGFLYLVCEGHNESFWEKLDHLRNGDGLDEDGLSNFAMFGMEICEAVISLHMEALIMGCLGSSCFKFDEFGHVYVDLSEVLVMGRMVCRGVKAGSGGRTMDDKEMGVLLSGFSKSEAFVSPEVLFELLRKEGVGVGCDSFGYAVGYVSDVWLLACFLLRLLIGKQFTNELVNYMHHVLFNTSEENSSDHVDFYMGWLGKVSSFLETKFGTVFQSLQQILCQCLNFDPGSRPHMTDVWKCIRELIIKPHFDKMIKLDESVCVENRGCCFVLGELCQLPKESLKTQEEAELQGEENNGGADLDQVGQTRVNKDVVKGLLEGNVKFKDMQGHLDCVTGLVVGGDFLLSSSFDKSVHVWSLQDFSHVHTFKGHEHKVMAMVYVDEEQPLCVSGDSGGGIFVWSISIPFEQEPIKKWYEPKDWRYSGIHALTISGNGYLYTGGGDKSIKAWSLQDGTLSCTLNGHNSVVSTLTVCEGILYSGSWDGTIRLWSTSDHSLLTVLGEDTLGTVTSVLSLTADRHTLVAAYENGSIKVWRNDVFMKSSQTHNGAIFAIGMEGKWLFTGGWDKIVNVQELTGDEFQVDARPIGSIPCGSVVTALLCWQGKLFVGYADKSVKVYYYGK